MPRELTPEERDLRSRTATITNLRRAGQPEYNGAEATAKARSAAWQKWLDMAGGDSVKAKRLMVAAQMEGRLRAKQNKSKRSA